MTFSSGKDGRHRDSGNGERATSRRAPVIEYGAHDAATAARTRIAWLVLWVLPLVPVITIYLSWASASGSLGHVPRPNLDDPKSISPVVSMLTVAAGYSLMLFPVVLLAVPIFLGRALWLFWRGDGPDNSKLVRRMWLSAIWYAAIVAILLWDPARAVVWLLD